MRLFEAILIVVAGQFALAVAVMGGRRPRWVDFFPLVLLAPLTAHLALEGARWQMGPAYLAVIGFCIEGVVRYARAARDTSSGVSSARAGGASGSTAGVTGFVLLMLSAAALAFFR